MNKQTGYSIYKEEVKKRTNKGYLVYCYSENCELHDGMDMKVNIIEVTADTERVKKPLEKARGILNEDIPPEPNKICEYYNWAENVIGNTE